MLVLSRKPKEVLVFKIPGHENVRVIVSNVNGTKVRLAIDAPRNIEVIREELISDKSD